MLSPLAVQVPVIGTAVSLELFMVGRALLVMVGSVSSSTSVIVWSWSARVSYSLALAASLMVAVMVAVWVATLLSSTPVMVTVCGVFQLALVNVSEPGATVASAVSLELRSITTSLVGWLSRTTV